MSVFEKHGDGIKLYEDSSGAERGRLLYAMAILSDCQEMVGEGDVSEELNEAKELIASVMAKLQPMLDLWGCRETIRDGEADYGCQFLVRAANSEEAERKAWEYVSSNYSESDERPYTEKLNESGCMELEGDYRYVTAEVERQIHTTEELVNFIGLVS